jgi:hypothetical protein
MPKLEPRLRHSKPQCEPQKSETPNAAQFAGRLVKSSCLGRVGRQQGGFWAHNTKVDSHVRL